MSRRPRVRIINHIPARDRRAGDYETLLTVKIKGDEGQVRKLLEYIGETAAIGHSFSVVVDPGDSDHEKSFGFDGDGAFRIVGVE